MLYISRWKAIAILTTAAVFGFFHLVTPNAIVVERFLPTFLLGIVLGWIRFRSGSIWPGMLLHICHNGLIVMIFSYEKELIARGWGIEDQSHLPPAWLGVAALMAMVGALLVRGRLMSGGKPEPDVVEMT